MESESESRVMAAKQFAVAKEKQILRAKEMKTAGYSNVEISRAMGLAESTVRMLLES